MSHSDETAIVLCGTSKGDVMMELHRSWSPIGYDRAVELMERKFYDGSHFYRVVPNFLVQFGITYSTNVDLKHFANTPIPDDPQLNPPIPFHEGTISYAGSGDNSRTSQLFIAYADSKTLGTQKWETPIGKVIDGMQNVKNFYSYGDMPPWGQGPVQGKIHSGRSYIEDNFPLTDKFHTCTVQRKRSQSPDQNETEEKLLEEQHEEVQEEEDEDWSSTPVKKEKTAAALVTSGGLKEKLQTKFQNLRSKVQESDTSYDAIVMGVIAVIILLAAVLKFSMRPKKATGKKS